MKSIYIFFAAIISAISIFLFGKRKKADNIIPATIDNQVKQIDKQKEQVKTEITQVKEEIKQTDTSIKVLETAKENIKVPEVPIETKIDKVKQYTKKKKKD